MKLLSHKERAMIQSLETVLEELVVYGRPRLYCHRDMAWSCTVALNTNYIGMSGECRSEFDHKTPIDAAMSVLNRCKALKKKC